MDQLIEFVTNHTILWAAFAGTLVMTIKVELDHQSLSKFRISPAAAVRLMNSDELVIIDLRDENDYRNGHLQDAKRIPSNEVEDYIERLGSNKSRPVMLYCRSGNISAKICKKLHKAGFASAYTMVGGVLNWQSENLPVSR